MAPVIRVYCAPVQSLAVVVVLIVFGIIGLGVVSFVVAVRPARRTWTRVLFLPAAVVSVLAGGWLAVLDIGGPVRVIGVAVALAGAAALWRSLRSATA